MGFTWYRPPHQHDPERPRQTFNKDVCCDGREAAVPIEGGKVDSEERVKSVGAEAYQT